MFITISASKQVLANSINGTNGINVTDSAEAPLTVTTSLSEVITATLPTPTVPATITSPTALSRRSDPYFATILYRCGFTNSKVEIITSDATSESITQLINKYQASKQYLILDNLVLTEPIVINSVSEEIPDQADEIVICGGMYGSVYVEDAVLSLSQSASTESTSVPEEAQPLILIRLTKPGEEVSNTANKSNRIPVRLDNLSIHLHSNDFFPVRSEAFTKTTISWATFRIFGNATVSKMIEGIDAELTVGAMAIVGNFESGIRMHGGSLALSGSRIQSFGSNEENQAKGVDVRINSNPDRITSDVSLSIDNTAFNFNLLGRAVNISRNEDENYRVTIASRIANYWRVSNLPKPQRVEGFFDEGEIKWFFDSSRDTTPEAPITEPTGASSALSTNYKQVWSLIFMLASFSVFL